MSFDGMDYDDRGDRHARAWGFVLEDTQEALSKFLAGDKSATVDVINTRGHRVDCSVEDWLIQSLDDDDTHAAFIKLLAESKCQLVAEFKKAIVNQHMQKHGDELADWMVTA